MPAKVKSTAAGGPIHLVRASPVSFLDAPAHLSRNRVVVVVEQNTGACVHINNRLRAAVTCVMGE